MQGIRTTMMARINSERYTLACAAAAAAGAAAISSLFGDPSTDQDEEQIESNHHSTITSIATIPRHRNERQWWWQTPTNWALPSTPLCRCDNSSETVLQSSSSSSRMPVQRSIRFSKRITDAVPRNVRLEDLFQVHWDTPLGEGGFGSVYSATDRSSGELVACKQMSKECTDDVAFQREMEAFLHLREHGGHPNICTLRETFEEGSDYYLILDLILGGEMFDHLIRHGAYSEADAARLMREIASALAFLHGTGCVHGDLKPENLMLSTRHSSDAVVKLIDFGCAQLVGRDDIPATDVKTEAYCPPEVLKEEVVRHKSPGKTSCSSSKSLEPSMDMWALGIILYIMLTGFHPFDFEGDSPDSVIVRRIIKNTPFPVGRDSKYTSHLSKSACDLIRKLLAFDPKDRITALDMLDHPWVRGETAHTDKIADIDKKLSKFRVFKSSLEAKVFADLFTWSDERAEMATKKTSLIERSFRSFDEQHKGFVTAKDLKRRIQNDGTVDDSDEDELSLSNFEDLLSEGMKNKYFPRGHVVYSEGEEGNFMFFINSGVIEISTKDGFRLTVGQGDFVGEGALLSPDRTRSATVQCVTPVHVIEISRAQFEKYLSASHQDINLKIREKRKARALGRTKAILRQQKDLKETEINKGTAVYNVGDDGKAIYILEKGKIDVRAEDGTTVFTVDRGDLFGERAVLGSRPRATSAVCMTEKCTLHVMDASAFRQVLKESPCLEASLTNTSLRREFQKAVVFHTKRPFPTTTDALREVFDLVDADKSGKISLDEIRIMLKGMNPLVPEAEIRGVLEALDIDESNVVNFEEFKLIFGIDGSEGYVRPSA